MKSIITIVNSRLKKDRLIDKDGLGDRTQYIGASEVAGCSKKSYLEKTQPEKVIHDDKQLMIFERGHLAENIVKKSLESEKGLKFSYQKEVQTLNMEVKAHLDFIIHEDDGSNTVVECKTTTLIGLDEPRESWIAQIQIQMGLLKQETKNGNIKGIIYAIDLNNGLSREWIVDYDKELTKDIITKAKKLYKDVQDKKEPEGTINPLCAFCAFRYECSTLNDGSQKVPEEIFTLAKQIKSFKEKSEKKIKDMTNRIKTYMINNNIKKATDGEINLSISKYTRTGFNSKQCMEDNPELKKFYEKKTMVEKLNMF